MLVTVSQILCLRDMSDEIASIQQIKIITD